MEGSERDLSGAGEGGGAHARSVNNLDRVPSGGTQILVFPTSQVGRVIWTTRLYACRVCGTVFHC